MSNIMDSISKMRFFDDVAKKKTRIHDIHPLAKLLTTVVYLFMIVSFGKYDIGSLLVFVFYPVVIISLAEIPVIPILKRVLLAAPFVIGVGLFNPIFDREIITVLFGIPISGGWVSFISLLLKCSLTVLGALLLLATTGMESIASAIRRLFVPRIFVLQLLLTYRYIGVLLEEATSIWNAYMLRAPGQKGISYKAWGPLAGQLLIRTFDRAQRVYQAMVLRGFDGEYNTGSERKLGLKDYLYLVSWVAFFVIARYFNLPLLVGSVIIGVGK